MYCLPICKEDPDEHIGNIFLSGGIEHGSNGNELLGLHLLYLLGEMKYFFFSRNYFINTYRKSSFCPYSVTCISWYSTVEIQLD